jgi:hypothetical protein
MTRCNRAALTLAAVLATGALTSGCGGSDATTAAAKPDSQQQAKDDLVAKLAGRAGVTEMEACFVDQASYAPCKPTTAGATSTATDTGYTVTAKSKSGGNVFTVTKGADGALTRTCTTKGQGLCPASGPDAANDW